MFVIYNWDCLRSIDCVLCVYVSVSTCVSVCVYFSIQVILGLTKRNVLQFAFVSVEVTAKVISKMQCVLICPECLPG